MAYLEKKYQKDFLPALKYLMESLGFFEWKKNSGVFTKDEGDGTIGILSKPVYFGLNKIFIEISCCVSIKFVQDILVKIGYVQSAKLSDITWTIGINIGELSIGRYKNWEIQLNYSETEISKVVDLIRSDVVRFGLPYLCKFSKISHMHALAYDPENPAKIDFIFPENQSLVAAIISEKIGLVDEPAVIFDYTVDFFRRTRDDDYDLDCFVHHFASLKRILAGEV